MMALRKIMVSVILGFTLTSCFNSDKDCPEFELKGKNNLTLYVRPYSNSDLVDNEIKRGLLEKDNRKTRKHELEELIHYKIRIMNTSGFNDMELSFLNHDLAENIALLAGEDTLKPTLFINESSFANKNIAQYFVGFHIKSTIPEEVNQLIINVDKIGLHTETILFHSACFQ
jgi:hypothetical protein